MKLLFDARVLTHRTFTGIENYTRYLLKHLQTNITIAMPRTNNKYLSHLWSHCVLPFKKGDLLFCPANSAPIFIPKSKKLVITVHDIAFLTYPQSFSKFFQLYYTFLFPKNIKRADKIITISQASKDEILKFFPDIKNKIHIIPLGIDKHYRVLDSIEKQKQILYVGSINERKNLVGVIEAFEKLPQELNYKLVIVGNFYDLFSLSPKMQECLKRAKRNSAIVFKHNIDDDALVKEYNISTVLLFPSFYEGFGLPPLEAMACGTPVITSNCSSMPEVCQDAALYVNPHDPYDIAQKLQLLLEDQALQNELIAKGFKRAREFTWEKSAQKHLDLFLELMG